jgi:hypothetical protein
MSLILATMFVAGVRLEIGGTSWRDQTVAALGDGACFVFFRHPCSHCSRGNCVNRRQAPTRVWAGVGILRSANIDHAIRGDRRRPQ